MGGWWGHALKRLLGDEAYFRLRARRRFWAAVREGRPVVFVHQMGKVGSLSVLRELKRKREWVGRTPVFYHTHYLSEGGIRYLREIQEAGHGGWRAVPPGSRRHIGESRGLSDALRSGVLDRVGCRVVSLVRDPVAVDLSGFFHNVAWWPAGLREACERREPGWREALLAHFLERFPHDIPLRWFDGEMAAVFGIDVYGSGFPRELGYRVYERGRVQLMVLKLEMLGVVGGEAFRQFMGIEDFAPRRENAASAKPQGEIYEEFLSGLVLPGDYLDRMYGARHSRHFYGEGEIRALRGRWGGASGG